METVKNIGESAQVQTIVAAWTHNGELIVQDVTGQLQVLGRFVPVAAEEKPAKKARKPRAKRNGLAAGSGLEKGTYAQMTE